MNTAGYLYTYFSGDETLADDQQVRFAVSRDGLHWSPLNGGRPVLESQINDCGARDPFVLRLADGGFVLIATDLNTKHPRYADAEGRPDWDRMESDGRTDILVWRSDDLAHWSGPTLLPVADGVGAGNAWAPKAVWVPQAGRYLIAWSSATGGDGYAKERIYGCWTGDFTTCSEPFPLFDDAHSRIDMLLMPCDDRWLMVIKDERDKRIDVKVSARLFDGDGATCEPLSAGFADVPQRALADLSWVEGPAAVRRADGTTLLFVDEYANARRGYIPLIADDPTRAGSFRELGVEEYEMPPFARHGSLLAIDENEWRSLTEAFGGVDR